MTWHDAGPADSEPGGGLRRVDAGGVPVVLVRSASGWSAFRDRCPHAGAPLSEGTLRDGHLVCSWHGWRFDAETGTCPLYPGAPSLVRHDVRVEAGRVLVGV